MINSQHSAYSTVNCIWHSWTLPRLIHLLSLVLGFQGHCSFQVVFFPLTLLIGSLLISLTLKQCPRAPFSRLFSICICCLGDLQIISLNALQAPMSPKFLSAGQSTLLKIGLVHLLSTNIPFWMSSRHLAFSKPNSLFPKTPARTSHRLPYLINTNSVFSIVQATNLLGNLS